MKWVTPHPAANAATIDRVAVRRFMDIPPQGQFFVSGMLCRQSALGQRANHAAPLVRPKK
jgi:hypothetical protein